MKSIFSSLTNRIFLAGSVIVMISIVTAVTLVNVSVTARAEADLRTGLREAASLVDELSRAEFDQFRRDAGLVANLPDLKNAVSTDEPPTAPAFDEAARTVQPIAEAYQRELRADVFLVTGRGGHVLARAGRVAPAVNSLDAIVAAKPAGAETWFWPYDGGILQVAALPIEPGPATLGTLIVGLSLDQAAAEHIKQLTDSEITLVANGRIVASTFEAGRSATLASFANRVGLVDSIVLGDEDYIANVQPLGANDPRERAPVAIVLRSRTDRLQFLRSLHRYIAATAAIAILLATLVAYSIARTVTRPLRALTATMGEMAATGDLARALPPAGAWDDEDAQVLASTFRQLTTALDRFRREAAQRERLSSLGRLSTVIAHEIRNPLMIIKTTLRDLRRQPSPEVAASAASIDEEVNRLNRVVTDVLDFAKPIRVEIAPADLVAICRMAARAVDVGAGEVDVRVETTVDAAPIHTDAERLRAVLVNLLTNAQVAVRDHEKNDKADGVVTAPIVLRISSTAASWCLDVIDGGIGIAPGDLGRVFEPFFTTRHTGSGLGLAISRNIVESLGGTIVVRSELGAGTTVHLDLPRRSQQS